MTGIRACPLVLREVPLSLKSNHQVKLVQISDTLRIIGFHLILVHGII